MINLSRHEVAEAGAGILRCECDFAGSFGASLRTMVRVIQASTECELVVSSNEIHVIADVERIGEQIVLRPACLVEVESSAYGEVGRFRHVTAIHLHAQIAVTKELHAVAAD